MSHYYWHSSVLTLLLTPLVDVIADTTKSLRPNTSAETFTDTSVADTPAKCAGTCDRCTETILAAIPNADQHRSIALGIIRAHTPANSTPSSTMPCHVHVPGTQAPTIVHTCPQQAAPVPRAHEVGAAAISSFAPPITLQPACSVVPQSSATAHDITARIIADVTARNADNTTSQTSANTDARTAAGTAAGTATDTAARCPADISARDAVADADRNAANTTADTTTNYPAGPGIDVCGDNSDDILARGDDVTSRLVENMYAATNEAELLSAVRKAEAHYSAASPKEEAFERVLWSHQARSLAPPPPPPIVAVAH